VKTCPEGTLMKVAQRFVLGYFRRVSAGLISSNSPTTGAILIATC
jgi:hypothetical protein